MTYIIGLTGSIGMGKSTTAKMFANEGIPVWDADQVVRNLYASGGKAVKAVKKIAPTAIEKGAVSRALLRQAISDDPTVLDQLNAVIHPLVAEDRAEFIAVHEGKIVLLDVPLLFEGGIDQQCDIVAVVSVPPDVQKQRVLDRGEMTEAEFDMILARQMPDAEKRAKADHLIETLTLDGTRENVRHLLKQIRQKVKDA